MKPLMVTSAPYALLIVTLAARVAFAVSPAVVSGLDAAATVSISDLAASDATVQAVLVNHAPHTVKDVKLLIRHGWLWNNERHPGTNSPGRSDYYIVHGEIPAGGRLPFTYRPDPPLPQRSDGHFTTAVDVVGFTEMGE